MTQTTKHQCNAYCSTTEHCDLIYVSRQASTEEIGQVYGYQRGLKVLRVEQAHEAPPFAAVTPENRDVMIGRGANGDYAYLVWWQA